MLCLRDIVMVKSTARERMYVLEAFSLNFRGETISHLTLLMKTKLIVPRQSALCTLCMVVVLVEQEKKNRIKQEK